MLKHLAIRDVVLVERLELDFEPGLGVLTGETGAGKSILLDALGLALGSRADSGLVRSGADSASVSAEIGLADDHPAFALLADQGIERDPGEPLLIRRSLKGDGGSRAFIGASAVPAALLRDIGAAAVEVHGQHDDRGLLNPKGHRDLLDLFGRLDSSPVAASWTAMAAIDAELAAARSAAAEAERDRDYLAHALAEIEALAPEAGEESALAEERSALQAAIKAGEGLTGTRRNARRVRRRARPAAPGRAADRARRGRPPAARRGFGEPRPGADRSERGRGAHRPRRRRAGVRSRAARSRRGAAVRHPRPRPQAPGRGGRPGRSSASACAPSLPRSRRAASASPRSRPSSRPPARRISRPPGILSEQRRAAALRLDSAVAAELAPLKLDSARFRTAIAAAEPGPSGIDRVEFEISTNPGAPFGPLTRIASGGELSRFILALKVALAEAGSAATMIFDEIDRGVGGAVASAIGERLARLAERSQVLVVTHSPQVAARAAHHYRIDKAHAEGVTRTHVRKLGEAERREEIARMLSGANVTDEARAQAAKLLEAA